MNTCTKLRHKGVIFL